VSKEPPPRKEREYESLEEEKRKIEELRKKRKKGKNQDGN
jgi:hypothetical protein